MAKLKLFIQVPQTMGSVEKMVRENWLFYTTTDEAHVIATEGSKWFMVHVEVPDPPVEYEELPDSALGLTAEVKEWDSNPE